MSQHDMNLANASGPTFRADANAALVALATCSSGATAPTVTFARQLWLDTTAGLLKIRNAANSAWITLPVDPNTSNRIAGGVTVGGYLFVDQFTVFGNPSTGFMLFPRHADGGDYLAIWPCNSTIPDQSRGIIITRATGVLRVIAGGVEFPDGTLKPTAGIVSVNSDRDGTTATGTGTIWTATGLSITVTPQSTNSRFILTATVSGVAAANEKAIWAICRGGTPLVTPTSPGNRTPSHGNFYTPGADSDEVRTQTVVMVDAPATTSPVTYTVQIKGLGASETWYYNRSVGDTDSALDTRHESYLTAVEIGGVMP